MKYLVSLLKTKGQKIGTHAVEYKVPQEEKTIAN